MTRTLKLHTQPSRTRLQSGIVATGGARSGKIDRTGGQFGAGIIPAVSAITRGEALGHDFWIDDVFLGQVAAALAAATDGSKCRFTHPGLSADGLAKGLGLAIGGRLQGDQVLTDLHFYASAHKSPDGDLAGYVMDRADEDPLHFGTSIMFISDEQAEQDFMLAHGGQIVIHEDDWETYETIEGFQSPDPLNTDNLPHCRLLEFLAVDVVDDPAANPNGLFHRDLSTIDSATEFLDFALGLSAKKPTTIAFGVDPERARLFLQRYAAQRGFQLPTKGTNMSKLLKRGKLAAGDPQNPPVDPTAPPVNPDPNKPAAPLDGTGDMPPAGAVTCPDCGAVFVPDDAEPAPISDVQQTPVEYAAAHKRYVDAFGAENGNKWFFGRVKFSDAQQQHFRSQLAAKDQQIASLQSQLKSAQERLAAIANQGERPLSASAPPTGTEGQKGTGFASLFRIPTSN
ncbi:MAG: hypothetical protein JSS49_27465 [Planctomycetes bacterium]|nr:hypothetical protein [Planctomycetota bacterium]